MLPSIKAADLGEDCHRLPPGWQGDAFTLLQEPVFTPSHRLSLALTRGRCPEELGRPFAVWCVEYGLQHPYYQSAARRYWEYQLLQDLLAQVKKLCEPGYTCINWETRYRLIRIDVNAVDFRQFHLQHLLLDLSDKWWDVGHCAVVCGRVSEMLHDDDEARRAYEKIACNHLAGMLAEYEMKETA